MKMKFTSSKLLIACLLFSSAAFSQADGDYRSNVTTTGVWNIAGNWQIYDGGTTSWITASSAPTSANGVITIQAGDSIRLNNGITIDQVVIESGAALAIFNTGGGATFTINNGTGNDVTVNGNLHISQGATVTGAGNIVVNSGGLFGLRNSGSLGVPLTSAGLTIFGSVSPATAGGTINGTTLTLNAPSDWVNGDITLTGGATLTTNSAMRVSAATATNLLNSGSNTFNISGSGSFTKTSSSATTNIAATVNIASTATIAGVGLITFTGSPAVTNTGFVSPGTSPGILNTTPALITGQAAKISIEVVSGSGAGTGHDQLALNASTSLTNATLTVTDNPTAPIGVYTIMTSSGSFTGPFATANIPPNYGNLTISGGTVTVEKLSILPVSWASFTAIAQNSKVQLNWSTASETNAAYYTVEHSSNGRDFTSLGNVSANGNTTSLSEYSFSHASPSLNALNLYRIKQVDIDGSFSYSEIRNVRFTNGNVKVVTAGPNPVINELQISVQTKNILVTIHNLNGIEVRRWRFEPGTYQVYLQDLSAGMYQLNVFENGVRVDGQRLIKL